MNLEKRIIAFAKLGDILRNKPKDKLLEAVHKAEKHNGWFTGENIFLAQSSLGKMLEEKNLRKWLSKYKISNINKEKKIGVIMAGNIPMVGFHDFLCVLMSGNIFIGKLSSDDEYLLPAIADILIELEPKFKSLISFTKSPVKSVDAYIATGGNNSARYFEYYFRKYPHIIRKNRNAIAVLNGKETSEDLKKLGNDIFQYFGLGCRNVSKIFIPEDYDLDKVFSAIVDFGDVIHHNKYFNNYNHYRSIYMLGKEKFLDNHFLLMKETKQIASPVATLYYERYKSNEELSEQLENEKGNIQCIVSANSSVKFGQTQSPQLWDYADCVDTMEFLLNL